MSTDTSIVELTDSHKKRRIHDVVNNNKNDDEVVNDNETINNDNNNNNNNNTSTMTFSNRNIQFLMVHYHILKSLYTSTNHHEEFVLQHADEKEIEGKEKRQTENEGEQVSSSPSKVGSETAAALLLHKEPELDDKIWYQIQNFIQHQIQYVQIQQQLKRNINIHKEAIQYCNGKTNTMIMTSPTTVTTNTANDSNDPYLPSMETNQNSISNSRKMNSKHSNNTFQIIANIIGQQSKMNDGQQHLQQQQQQQQQIEHSIQQLLHVSTQRIQSLTSIYQQYQQSIQQHNIDYVQKLITASTSSNKTAMSSNNEIQKNIYQPTLIQRSYMIEIQYKIQLWSYLLYDLNYILSFRNNGKIIKGSTGPTSSIC